MTDQARSRPAVPARLLPALAILLLLSGFSALVYQVLWLRLLSLVFGVTVHAASTVLAAFMAGLALGSVLAGAIADRVRRPLVWFGAAEALIGITALASPVALGVLERAFVGLAASLQTPVLITAARFLGSFAVLIIPTSLMGATLPLVLKASLRDSTPLAKSAGLLYGANTAGAVAGALVAGSHLIGQHGIRTSFLIAAGVNFLVALASVVVGTTLSEPRVVSAESSGTASPAFEPTQAHEIGARRAILVVFTLSGLASLALEVIWFRILVVYLGGTIYAFVSMLSTVLAGIAIGSWIAAPLMRRRREPLMLLLMVQTATALATILSFVLIAELYDQPWLRMSHVTTLAIAPATLLMGVAFPMGLGLWAGTGGQGVGRRIGLFYALNVCGAICGTILAGFVLLPGIGARNSVVATAAVFIVCALVMVRWVTARPSHRWALAAMLAGLFSSAAMIMPDPFDAALSKHPPVVWREEGVQTTVSVHRRPEGTRVMYLDGLHQANDSPELVKVHRQIGLLPLALHPNPKRALVIGLGGGATAGAVSRYTGLSVDVVELSRAVAHGAAWFSHVNYDVLNAPSVRLRVDDGRSHLLLSGERYDVVTADIIQPIHAGAGSLYSVEYFRLARAALNDGGLMLQWIGHRETTPYKVIMRTFLTVFPHATLWADGSLMVGSVTPLQIDQAAFALKLEDSVTREALAAIDLDNFDALLELFTAGPDEMRALVGSGTIATDDRPLLEYFRALPPGEEIVDLTNVRGDVGRHVKRAGR